MSDTDTAESEADLGALNRQLAVEVLETVGSEHNFDLMAEDVVIEFPYGPSLGMPERFVGKADVTAYLRQMFDQVVGLKMRDIRTHSVAGHPEIVFAEYEGDAPTAGGNSYEQVYQSKLEFRGGLLVRMREFWDPKRIIDATNGTYDGNLHP
jgi:ketosteroid isomerase-like protein